MENHPIRIQRKRIKGYKLPINTKSVTRPHKYGNPFRLVEGWIEVNIGGNWRLWSATNGFKDQDIVDLFEKFITGQLSKYSDHLPATIPDVTHLRGFNLACFCAIGKPCHADVLLKLANQ